MKNQEPLFNNAAIVSKVTNELVDTLLEVKRRLQETQGTDNGPLSPTIIYINSRLAKLGFKHY